MSTGWRAHARLDADFDRALAKDDRLDMRLWPRSRDRARDMRTLERRFTVGEKRILGFVLSKKTSETAP